MNRPEDLLEAYQASDPLLVVEQWLHDADGVLPEPRAMALATVAESGMPSVRMVLLRGLDARGFTWYTNFASRKGKELLATPRASLVLHHQGFERQVRAEGPVVVVDAEEADAYFSRRPRGHQLSAWASSQSEPLPQIAALREREAAASERFEGTDVPRPDYWGGFRLEPTVIELWQGRVNRMHDRIQFTRTETGWSVDRLQP
ncbi:MAG: pyridoxamine 5'-phosphate oxidase [Actinomycetota bacterium]